MTQAPASPIPQPPKSKEPSRLALDVTESGSDASVTTGDWIARIGPVMRSLKVVADGYDHCIYVLPALVAGRFFL